MQKSLLALLGVSSGLLAAQNQNCAPTPPATCYADDCNHCYCLGPENYQVNAPVCPTTCNGDFNITVAGFYWNSHQDGMEYAINDRVQSPDPTTPTTDEAAQLTNLVDSNFENPNFKWDFGFKAGLSYCTTCDGWDIGILWTWYRGKANSHVEAEYDDNRTLLPLWSVFNSVLGGAVYASDMETYWKLEMNLVDIELGRQYWVSKYLTMRPHLGLRIAFLNQGYDIQHKGGSWSAIDTVDETQKAYNGYVNLDNDFKGVGVRGGLDSLWNLGCGWGIYGNFAAAIVYGRFNVEHDESVREAGAGSHKKINILETNDHFRASRGMFDLGLGVQWHGMFCDCSYGMTVALGWEQHIFLHQNQMWRVNRIGDQTSGNWPNNNGENVYVPSRGTLDTSGVTLKLEFTF